MIEAVLFDIGDTLIHFDTSHPRELVSAAVRAIHALLVERGHRTPPVDLYENVMWRRLVRAFFWSRLRRREVDLLRVVGAVHRRFGIALADDALAGVMGGCARALRGFLRTDGQALRTVSAIHNAGFALGIVSNVFFPATVVDGVLQAEGLLDFFTTRIYSSDVGYRKPHREIFRITLRSLGVRPAQTLYVGDNLRNDVRGASRVGMTTAWLTENEADPVCRARPDHVIRELSELLPILQVDQRHAR